MIVCPSRELARQTHEVIQGYITAMKEDGLPELRSLLVMGGIDMRTQVGISPQSSAISASSIFPHLIRLCSALIGFDMGGTSTDMSRFAGSYEHVIEIDLIDLNCLCSTRVQQSAQGTPFRLLQESPGQ